MPPVSIPEVVFTNNVMPPPLIPVASFGPTTNCASQQSSVIFSVPDARSLYTTPVGQFTNHGLFPTHTGGYVNTQQFATSCLPKLSLLNF